MPSNSANKYAHIADEMACSEITAVVIMRTIPRNANKVLLVSEYTWRQYRNLFPVRRKTETVYRLSGNRIRRGRKNSWIIH